MSSELPTSVAGDKLKKALVALSECVQKHPEKSRASIINEIEVRFDLTPRESQFLHDHFEK